MIGHTEHGTQDTDARKTAPRHSEGPWQIRDDYTREGCLTIIANIDGEYFTDSAAPVMTYDTIAICKDEFEERLPNAEANARLIAAAPMLLEALQAFTRRPGWKSQTGCSAYIGPQEMDAINVILAKATGAA